MAKENKPEPGIDVDLQKRRKIVKGIAGLPALVTLASGSGAANASVLQCVQDAKYRPAQKLPDGSDRDYCIDEAVGENGYFVQDLGLGNRDDAARIKIGDDYCLAYVDDSGNPVTSPPGHPSELVTTSCYTSFATSAINRIT